MTSTVDELVIPNSFGGVDIMPVSNAINMGVCMGLYGSGGSGKTTIAGKLGANYGPLLYIDAEGGASAIRSLEGVTWAPVTKFSQVERIASELKKENPFRTVVVDNLSELQNLSINAISAGGDVQIQHWGRCTADMLKLVRSFRELSRHNGINVILICWDDPIKNEEGALIKTGVGFTPSLARQFPGIISFIGHVTVYDRREDTRILSFKASSKSDAKFRVDRNDIAATIPQELYVGIDANPLEDIFNTIYQGTKFPASKYEKPKAGN